MHDFAKTPRRTEARAGSYLDKDAGVAESAEGTNLSHREVVLVQREMESGRSLLASIEPFGRPGLDHAADCNGGIPRSRNVQRGRAENITR
jgi:hypothetical protein